MPSLNWNFAEVVNSPALAIIEQAPLPGLGYSPKCESTRRAIEKLLVDKISIGGGNSKKTSETLALSGLWLLAGELDRSHSLSQSIETAEGAYWHGIMHRREGDFWNSKYWFRRVGNHAVLAELAETMTSHGQQLEAAGLSCSALVCSRTLAASLVDLCQAAMLEKQNDLVPQLELICWWEWQLLFRYSLLQS